MIKSVKNFIELSNQYCYLIFGQRRIGKTSFLKQLEARICNEIGAIGIYFNLQAKRNTPLNTLLYELATYIELALNLDLNITKKYFDKNRAQDYFQHSLLPKIVRMFPNGKPLVLLLDEFDVMVDSEYLHDNAVAGRSAYEDFIFYLVSLLEQISETKIAVKFIIAIGRDHNDLNQNRYAQIFKSSFQKEIGYFDKPTVKKLLHIPGQPIHFSNGAINRIYELASGQPCFTQALASSAYDYAEDANINLITEELVNTIYPETIKAMPKEVTNTIYTG